MKILLASSSQYRRSQLLRIIPNFECFKPDIDESSVANETPQKLSERLARQKAQAAQSFLKNKQEHYLVIGSDQVAWLDDRQLHKPGSRAANIEQLLACSGQQVDFHTSVALWNTRTGQIQSKTDLYRVYFKTLSEEQIVRYVDREQAFDCAGGFKMEGLGICLFDKMEGNDPNSLIGLPLISLVSLLEQEAYQVL